MKPVLDPALSVQFTLGNRRSRIDGGNDVAVPQHRKEIPKAAKALALGVLFEDLVRNGVGKDYADVGRLSCLCRERVSQLVRLTFLAPDIQGEILALTTSTFEAAALSEAALRKIANHLDWAIQRQMWRTLKDSIAFK